MHDIAVPVGHHLHLDVPGMIQILLEVDPLVAEAGAGLIAGVAQCGRKLVLAAHHAHAAPAAAGEPP